MTDEPKDSKDVSQASEWDKHKEEQAKRSYGFSDDAVNEAIAANIAANAAKDPMPAPVETIAWMFEVRGTGTEMPSFESVVAEIKSRGFRLTHARASQQNGSSPVDYLDESKP
jgi:hypothetical protein